MPDTNNVYTLEDLAGWSQQDCAYAVLGHPVAHSLSPQMHNAALAMLKERGELRDERAYYKFDVPPERLPEALPLFLEKGFMGLNLTVPHKVEVLTKALAEPSAEGVLSMGAANTLKRGERGWVAYNTDGYGMSRAIGEAFFDDAAIPLRDVSVILLGAGGAARAAAFQCLREGCRELWIGNRNQERLATLLKQLDDPAVRGFNLSERQSFFPRESLLINATSLGLKSEDPLPLSLAGRSEQWRVFDMVYSPPETLLMREARDCGHPAVNGLNMLVWQGALALAIWLTDSLETACKQAPLLAPVMRESLDQI